MSGSPGLELMAQYNRWMNEKLYEAASRLGDAELRQDQGAFFKSILGTLNHLMVADTIWLKRFAAHPKRYEALQFLHDVPNPRSLDQILHPDLASLRKEREKLDEAIVRWQGEIEADDLAGDLEYANMKGDRFTDNFHALIQHFFNHQTHHRGQVTTLLSQKGIDVGSTDLLTLIRN